MRGVTWTSIEAPSAINLKHHIANYTGCIIKRTWPHPPSEAARSNPLCRQLHPLGRLDVTPVAHEGKRKIHSVSVKSGSWSPKNWDGG